MISYGESDARLGFVLDEEYSRKFIACTEYLGLHPHDLITQSIDRMYNMYQEIGKTDE